VIVKLWPGKSEQQKVRLAEAITKDVMNILHYGEESVSVAMEEIKPNEWGEKVYRPEIKNNLDGSITSPDTSSRRRLAIVRRNLGRGWEQCINAN